MFLYWVVVSGFQSTSLFAETKSVNLANQAFVQAIAQRAKRKKKQEQSQKQCALQTVEILVTAQKCVQDIGLMQITVVVQQHAKMLLMRFTLQKAGTMCPCQK